MRFATAMGTPFAAECPWIVLAQWWYDSPFGKSGSLPIAVGITMRSAPRSARMRETSGNHWSQQIAIPIFPNLVSAMPNLLSLGRK
ncbi:hypothetical protein ATCV1_z171L [Acanthocystis turfacea chlorella virus 1]|uniref:Uncharacterized protein z171L n=1 Tax=Chlorovirus heliozoae TaxID=322019 RepID=A7K8D1_9PHYC|nr:hypothetical protein ATCV1_z171L [Acanthocystis turfacea chlorella virus 1]ABT16305.1 hypothetical protein ATCV1_z171L [Acanthocystis turfacea chlorella virus 1]